MNTKQNDRTTRDQEIKRSAPTRRRATVLVVSWSLVLLSAFVLLPSFAHAASIDLGLDAIADTGLGTRDLRVTVANIIRVFLGLLGTVGVVLMVLGGFTWMTAAGNEEKIAKAKKILINAAIGLAIVLVSYSIVSFVIGRLIAGTGAGGAITDDTQPDNTIGGLGGGIVESHYPARNATGVPRNTSILITFKERMDAQTLLTTNGTPDPADDRLNPETIRIRRTIADPPRPEDFLTNVQARMTADGKTIRLRPLTLLGSPSEEIGYTIRLESGLRTATGGAAFGRFGNFYEWRFTVSTVLDTRPPKIAPDGFQPPPPLTTEEEPANAVVQVTFDEGVDPTVIVGDQTESVIAVRNGAARIAGTMRIGNQYRTAEFITNDLCGRNACGQDVFCLPRNATITTFVPSPRLSAEPPQAEFPFTGIVDLAGNAFDGNGNGTAEGPSIDDTTSSFATSNDVDLVPPTIVTTAPAHNAGGVAPQTPITVTFSKPILASTFNGSNITIAPALNFDTAMRAVNGRATIGEITHDPFVENSYAPTVSSGVKDAYQNCYFPCAGGRCPAGQRWTGWPSCTP